MFLNRKQKGYGWYTKVESKDNPTIHGYVNFSFKRGCEPTNLTEFGSYSGDLYFIDKDGNRRKVFPYVEEYQGTISVKFKILDVENENHTQPVRSISLNKTAGGTNVNGLDEDLPF